MYNKEFYNYLIDIRGSTSEIIDSNGEFNTFYRYSAFGDTEVEVNLLKAPVYNEICYAGAVYDESTELYYMNARYYDSTNGRFISQDSYRGLRDDYQSLHLYACCSNDPVNNTDLSGNAKAAIGSGGNLAKIYLNTHWAYPKSYHTSIAILIPKNHAAYNTKLGAFRFVKLCKAFNKRFSPETKVITLGAAEKNGKYGGKIKAERNRKGDLTSEKQDMIPINFSTKSGVLRRLLNKHGNFVIKNNNKLHYHVFGQNCNSYTRGLLLASGINAPKPKRNVMGWNTPILSKCLE